MLGTEADDDFVYWALAIQKQVIPVVREMIIQKYQEIHCVVYVSTCSVVLVGRVWCDRFMNRHQ